MSAKRHDASRRLRARDRPACRGLAPSPRPICIPAPASPRWSRPPQLAERGKFDLLFLADSAAVNLQGSADVARPHGQGREVRADDDPVGAGGGDEESRPGRDLDHDLQRALYARPPVRLARPDQRRPLGLEPRHLEQRAGCAELQPRRASRPRRPLRPRDRVRRRGQRPVGQLGRGRLHPRQGVGRLLRPGEDACAEPQGKALPGARAAQRRLLAAGPAGAGPGRRLGHRTRRRRPPGRAGVHRGHDLRAGQGVLCRRAWRACRASAARRTRSR